MKNSIRRFIGITSILAIAMSLVALPAAAATPNVSATLAAADTVLKAGETHNFSITFRNNEAAGTLNTIGRGATVDGLQIASPTFIFDPATFVVPETVGNFRTFLDEGTITLFDGTLAPQATLTVPFTARIKDHFSTDRGSTFLAQASQVNDDTAGPVTGDLSFIVDILQVDTISLTQPADVPGFESLGIDTGVDDGTVTAGQSGVTVEVGVTNNGGAAKDITATLTGVTGQATKTVAAHSSDVIVIPNVAFGSGNTTIDARLTATGADREPAADPAQLAVAVQAAPGLAKSSNISPDYVGLGSHPVNLAANKTGIPAVAFTATVTTTSQADGSSGPGFTVDRVIPRNNQSVNLGGTLNFGQLVGGVPQFTPGWYDVTATITGFVDDNGKPATIGPIDFDDIFFDPLAPIFDHLTFAGQAPFVGPRDAVKAGENFTYSLKLLNDGAGGGPCPQCPITLKVVDAADDELVYASSNVVTNNNGESAGSISGTWPDLSHIDVKLLASAADKGGNLSVPTESYATVAPDDETVKVSMIDTLPPGVDPAAPTLYGTERVKAYTGGFIVESGQNQRRTIDVIFDEPIRQVEGALPTTGLDWTVDGTNRRVTTAVVRTFETGGVTHWGVRLTLSNDLGRNERPGVSYAKASTSTNIQDRRQQNLINSAVRTIIDNIAPVLPDLTTVDGQDEYVDGEFHTNLAHYTGPRDDTPVGNDDLVLNLSNVEGGANVVIENAETGAEIATAENASTDEFITQEIRIPLSALGGLVPAFGETEVLELRIYATDTSGSSSPQGLFTVNLDRDAPGSAGVPEVRPASNEVVIAADEPLRAGRNDWLDWKVRINSDGDAFYVGVEEVTAGADDTERVLKVSNQWIIATGSEVEHARFAYVGDADARLVDPAGNRLPLVLNFVNADHVP